MKEETILSNPIYTCILLYFYILLSHSLVHVRCVITKIIRPLKIVVKMTNFWVKSLFVKYQADMIVSRLGDTKYHLYVIVSRLCDSIKSV